MEIVAKFEPNHLTEQKLEKIPLDVLFEAAKVTLDMTLSKNYFPFDTGKLNETSAEKGVRYCEGGCYIGSFTDYASYVWNLPQKPTHWTNDDTKAQWYAYTLKTHGKTILETAINKTWKDKF